MAEEDKNKPAVPPADPKAGGDNTQPNDPNKGGNMVPHARLNEEIEKRKAAEALLKQREEADAEAEKKRLAEANEYKTLFEQEKTQRQVESKKAREAIVRAQFVTSAYGKNIVNVDDAYLLAQNKLSDIKVADDGTVTGMSEVIDSLIKDKPYLLSKGSAPVGGPTNPAPAGGQQQTGTRIYTTEEIKSMSQSEYEKNKDDITKAQLEGRIKSK